MRERLWATVAIWIAFMITTVMLFVIQGDTASGPFSDRTVITLVMALGLTAVVVAAVLLWLGRVSPNRATAAALGSIAGGALGNLTDRIFRDGDGLLSGAVVDFIDVQWWPVWNVADMAIVLGGAALVLITSRTR